MGWSPSIRAFGGRFTHMLGSVGQAGLGRVLCCQIIPCLGAGGVLSCLPSALCEVGPAGPAPDCLPSHHHPMAGGLTHAASSSTGSGDLGKKQRRAWKKAITPVLGSDISSGYLPCPGTSAVPLLQLWILMSFLITTQTK